jgi:hypothetical protein
VAETRAGVVAEVQGDTAELLAEAASAEDIRRWRALGGRRSRREPVWGGGGGGVKPGLLTLADGSWTIVG